MTSPATLRRETATLADAAERCRAVLAATAIRDGRAVGWGTWELDEHAEPVVLHAGRGGLYDGNTGIAWALRLLGTDPGPVAGGPAPAGLLGGAAGIALAAGTAPPADVDGGRGHDLGDGLAGDLLAHVRTGSADVDAVAGLVAGLAGGAIRAGELACWADPRNPADPPLCGLAHGASGVALALAEAAVAYPRIAGTAAPLVAAALRWEAAWFDPLLGWPDLRSARSFPVLWCHGAAGIGAARLRLVQLLRAGLELDYAADAIEAEAAAAVRACADQLARGVELARVHGLGAVPYGLTLCHGLGGLLDVLVLAAEVWGEPAHLATARQAAAELLATAGPDPLAWPSGLSAPGSLGLFVGVAGTALVLARLVAPDRIGALSLLDPHRSIPPTLGPG